MVSDFKEYATHATKLWLQSPENNYKYYMALAAEALKQANNDKERAAEILAGQIENELKEAAPIKTRLYGDILTGALECIDFEEIARDFLDE